MNKLPLVSIIVPCYNAQSTIKPTLNALKNQTYPNIEYVFVDDGSTDSTKKILNDFKKERPNTKIVSQKNLGPSAARNNGFKASKGELIYFCDSDDQPSQNIVNVFVKTLNETNSDFVCCKFQKNKKCKNNIKNVSKKVLTGSDEIAAYLTTHWHYHYVIWNKLFRRSVLNKCFKDRKLFLEKIYNYEDLFFILKYVSASKKCCLITKALYSYKIRKNSVVRSKFSKQRMSLIHNINLINYYAKLFNKTSPMLHTIICECCKEWINLMIIDNWSPADVSTTFKIYNEHYSKCFGHNCVPLYKKSNLKMGNSKFKNKVNKYLQNKKEA